MLCSIRGVKVADKAINEEFADIQRAVEDSHRNQASVSSGLVSLFKTHPQILFASIVIPIAQQFTGMNAIMFVSPFPHGQCCLLLTLAHAVHVLTHLSLSLASKHQTFQACEAFLMLQATHKSSPSSPLLLLLLLIGRDG